MPPNDRSPIHEEILAAIRNAGPFASMEDLNRLVAARMNAYNSRPQADLGGLSPDQMSQLLYGDWVATGAFRIDASLTLDDVASAPILADARTILQYVADNGPIKPTQAGNLPRRDVQALLPNLRIGKFDDYVRPPAVNEADVLWLYVLRHLLQFAKLIVKRKGLVASANGRALLDDQRAGALYALLFQTLFRTFDLRFLDRGDRHPRLQSTITFSFYRLRTEARDWKSPEAIAESAWHPDAMDPPTPFEQQHGSLRAWSFVARVIGPLVQFGLMERRAVDPGAQWKTYEYRVTPLYDRFMKFQFGRSGPRLVP